MVAWSESRVEGLWRADVSGAPRRAATTARVPAALQVLEMWRVSNEA